MSVTSLLSATTTATTTRSSKNGLSNGSDNAPLLRNPSELQLKLEKQLQKSRQIRAGPPITKNTYNTKIRSVHEQMPLVSNRNGGFDDINLQNNEHDNDDDEDDEEEIVIFKQPSRGKALSDYSSDCTDQLLRDGFRLDELSDDEDLDLIPPKSADATWCSCDSMPSCSIQ